MRDVLAALSKRLRAVRGGRPAAYRPDFSDERFFRALARPSPQQPSPIQRATEAFGRGQRSEAVTAVVQHFRCRPAPRFFLDIDDVPRLLSYVEREHPQWRAGALERGGRDAEEGPSLAGSPSGSLTTTTGWGGVPEGPGGDILYNGRLHFFEFAPRMALAAVYGGTTASALEGIVAAWMALADDAAGQLRYRSDLTAGLRALALSWAWAFLAGAPRPREGTATFERLEFMILKILRTDAAFLEAVLDEATPNNHRLSSAFVLWYLGVLLPEFARSRRWRERGYRVWLAELARQSAPDGSEFEHALCYQLSVCEAAIAFVRLSERNGRPLPDWVIERTRRALEYHVTVGGVQPVPLGDCADYVLFPLPGWTGWTTASMREIGRAMFGCRWGPASREDPGVEQAFWLLGGALASGGDEEERGFVVRGFPDAGAFVFTSAEEGTQFLFRTGPPPGRPLFAGHMHADLLSVYLVSRGKPIVVEAGTYTYRTAAGGWRRYFAGPDSHNGLSIAGRDPLGLVTHDFRPRSVAARVTAVTAASALMAWVEGTMHGAGVYSGYRRGVISVDLGFWIVYDVFDPAPPAEASFGFQLEPGSRVCPAGGILRGESGPERLSIVPSGGLGPPSVVSGQRIPAAGWVAPRYGELVAAPQARFPVDGSCRATAFVLSLDHRTEPCRSVTIDTQPSGALTIEIDWGHCTDELIVSRDAGAITAFGGTFEGAVLWYRRHGQRPLSLRWLNARSFSMPALALELRAHRPLDSVGIEWAVDGVRLLSETDGLTIMSPGMP